MQNTVAVTNGQEHTYGAGPTLPGRAPCGERGWQDGRRRRELDATQLSSLSSTYILGSNSKPASCWQGCITATSTPSCTATSRAPTCSSTATECSRSSTSAWALAKYYGPGRRRRPAHRPVVTLWYRAPELLLGFTNYCVGNDL
ncbi:putative serine/threonine-protein kinase [Panicum miliaceum]|uniref:Serine/threonine-protein kinase n=1 Tax=Panicum miliaceum TaxID=4540 RepID=A0A3L6TJR0_PANMI|nr:putative serine/threonine-protein kinase [Panicum miliaceum]